jgi:hypothetical protein
MERPPSGGKNVAEEIKNMSSREQKAEFARQNGMQVQYKYNKTTDRYDVRIADKIGGTVDRFDCSRDNIARILGAKFQTEADAIENLRSQGLGAPKSNEIFLEFSENHECPAQKAIDLVEQGVRNSWHVYPRIDSSGWTGGIGIRKPNGSKSEFVVRVEDRDQIEKFLKTKNILKS